MAQPLSGPAGTYRVFGKGLTTLQEAQAIVDEIAPAAPRTVELVSLATALGRVLAKDVQSRGDIPPFDRATVDGYAVRSADTVAATPGKPVVLMWRGEVPMGGVPRMSLGSGEAVGVATGGMLPPGADAVVMVEHTQADGASIYVRQPVQKGDNVLPRGADVKAGGVVVPAGTRLGPAEVGALAGAGCVEVPVVPRPRVAIIATGDELVPPHREPLAGQIRDMNSYSLAAAVIEDGGVPIMLGRTGDSPDQLVDLLRDAVQRADMVLVSGGSSVGTRDRTVDGFATIGARIHLHGIALKPGKPTIVATLGDVLLAGLPGNPVSVLVIYHVLLRRALYKRMGSSSIPQLPSVKAILSSPVRRPQEREELVRVRLQRGNDGGYQADPVAGNSGMLQSLVRAHGYLFIPFSRDGYAAGEQVDIQLIPRGAAAL